MAVKSRAVPPIIEPKTEMVCPDHSRKKIGVPPQSGQFQAHLLPFQWGVVSRQFIVHGL
jgi:hypothetical protein